MKAPGKPVRLRFLIAGPALFALAVVASVDVATGGSHASILALVVGAGSALLLCEVLARSAHHRYLHPLRELVSSAESLAEGKTPSSFPRPENGALRSLSRSLELIYNRFEAHLEGLSGERDHLREILGSMSEGVLVVDRNGIISLVNPSFPELIGSTVTAEGEHVRIAVRRPEIVGLLERVIEADAAETAQVRITDPLRDLDLIASPLRNRNGVLLVARDETESKRLENQRSELVANVSHELKTPLTAIRGYAETLHRGALTKPEVAGRFTLSILEQCARLQNLLRDLLSLSRIESAESHASTRALELMPLAQRAIEVLAPTASEAEVEVRSEIDSGICLWGHRDEIEQIFLNLLENAIKYNRPGGTVEIRAQQSQRASLIEVQDSGIGIPLEDRRRIFERFYRVDKARSREAGGTGLGLAIVKHIVLNHGGTIDVESRVEHGSTFRITIPHGDENESEPGRPSDRTTGDDPRRRDASKQLSSAPRGHDPPAADQPNRPVM